MRRSEYDNVPNRIIPPYVSIDAVHNEHERSARIQPAPQPRQPLLGDPPMMMDPYHHGYPMDTFFNGGPPVVNQHRRRGFDKGPSGEDYTRHNRRQPLLRNPNLEVEHIGGDMDISRSRSGSPGAPISARMVRDDRRRDVEDRRDRKRTRSRSPRSSERSHSRREKRDRDHRRERIREDMGIPPRDGIIFIKDNCHEFLKYFIDELNTKIEETGERGDIELIENITNTTPIEKERINLPPDLPESDRKRMLHCDTIVTGLPASIFFGSGYGPREHLAKFSAGKDFIDKCNKVGVINGELVAAIEDNNRIDRKFKMKYSVLIAKAVHAIIMLRRRIAAENLQPEFMDLRILPSELVDRFKMMLRMVMCDVYYQGPESGAMVVPDTLKTDHDSRPPPRDSDMRSRRHVSLEPSAEDILRLREKEFKEKLEIEMAKKRSEMETEIRQQILEQERAKIRAEMEMEKKIEIMKIQQQQYEIEKDRKEMKEMEEQQKKAAMLKQVEDDFNTMVERLEQIFVEVRARGLTHVLDMIYNSDSYKTIQLYSTTLTSISFEQKQQFVKDLGTFLDAIRAEMAAAQPHQPVMNHLMNPMGPPIYPGGIPPLMGINPYQIPIQQQPPPQMYQMPPVLQQIPVPSSSSVPPSTSSGSKGGDKVHRFTLGNMKLRALDKFEQRKLKKGDKVIAQDTKTGNWSLATVVKISTEDRSRSRVTLTCGNITLKKYSDELYKEDDSAAPMY